MLFVNLFPENLNMGKNKKIQVEGKEISIIIDNKQEYISLTDMLKAKDGDFFYF